MFTGIVEETGVVSSVSSRAGVIRLRIRAPRLSAGVSLGDSVSISGVCLTVTAAEKDHFEVDVVSETARRSTFRRVNVGALVNLERAMRQDGRFGGHLVTGHVDGVGRIIKFVRKGRSAEIEINCPQELMRYVVRKGSVAIDGVSLTVAQVFGSRVKIAVVPLTLENTTLGEKRTGDEVNVETDLLGKYVERQVSSSGRFKGAKIV